MKKLSIVHAIVGAALLCMTPLSVHWSPVKGGSISFALETARAAELEVPPYRRAHRHYYRAAYYDLYWRYLLGWSVDGSPLLLRRGALAPTLERCDRLCSVDRSGP